MKITHTQSMQQVERSMVFLFTLVQVALVFGLFLAFRAYTV